MLNNITVFNHRKKPKLLKHYLIYSLSIYRCFLLLLVGHTRKGIGGNQIFFFISVCIQNKTKGRNFRLIEDDMKRKTNNQPKPKPNTMVEVWQQNEKNCYFNKCVSV